MSIINDQSKIGWFVTIKSKIVDHKSNLVIPLKKIIGVNSQIHLALKVNSIAANLPWVNFIGLTGLNVPTDSKKNNTEKVAKTNIFNFMLRSFMFID